MTINMILSIAIMIALIAACVILTCLYLKDKTKDEIRTDVYQLILKAEEKFLYGQNTQKFEYVVQLARSLLPVTVQAIVTAPLLETIFKKIIQELFNEIKDVMDDGIRNKSVKKQEEK